MELREIRRRILEQWLGTETFKKAETFFFDLFQNGTEAELANRRYIILTRKGFLLWLAAALCGLTGDRELTSDVVISDRSWKKMDIEDRHAFTLDKDVYLVDDTIVTGASIKNMYTDLDPSICRSRHVVTLFCDDGFRKGMLFENFDNQIDIGIIDRRERNAEILVALYKLAIPFTAESPAYHIGKVDRSIINEWKKLTIENSESGWYYEKEDALVFGGAGEINESFLMSAPSFKNDAENILFRGMRLCFREPAEEEDQQYVELTLIPWLMFDIFNYQQTIDFLEKLIDKANIRGRWLDRQIRVGEPSRRRVGIHRVISYLMAECVKKEFERDILNQLNLTLSPYQLFNRDIETYHYHEPLLEDVRALSSAIQELVTDDRTCYYADLAIGKAEHDRVADELRGISWGNLEIPYELQPMNGLCDELCNHRERKVDDETGRLEKPKGSKKFPILFYTGEDRGITALSYARRSIASFHSDIISHHEKLYLVNTLVPGEVSSLAYVQNYDFLWGLHHLLRKAPYEKGMETAFAKYWHEKNDPKLSVVSNTILKSLTDISFSFWPSRKYILKYYQGVQSPKKTPEATSQEQEASDIDKAIAMADCFYESVWKEKIQSANQ